MRVTITICVLTFSLSLLSSLPRWARGFSISAATTPPIGSSAHHKTRDASSSRCSISASDEDMKRWEQMWGGFNNANTESASISEQQQTSEIRVVTFDLDNTLWNTSATISAANDALAAFLDERNIQQPTRVEKVMGKLFQASKEEYCPLEGQAAKSPVLLTKLRKDALQEVLTVHNGYTEDDASAFADEAFQVWTTSRHEVIPNHYATSVLSCLRQVGSLQSLSGRPVLVGAVTDGNSNPRQIPELGDLFDFCVNAEGVGVSKPDKRLYLEALKEVTAHPHLDDIFGPPALRDSSLTLEAAEEMIGPWWVHVGDDFVKDIVACKSLKMRTVWCREFVKQEETTNQAPKEPPPIQTVEELVEKVSAMKVVEMSVGADDYLVDSLSQEFADAVVDSFGSVAKVLAGWQEQATTGSTTALAVNAEPNTSLSVLDATTNIKQASMPTDKPSATKPVANAKTKFCVYCGEKLPVAAKFCSSCGQKQPEL